MPYLFTSERLGFRNWKIDDLEEFSRINSDKHVMEHFPSPLTKTETAEFIDRLIAHFEAHGYNYFATEERSTGRLIGFIGLAYQTYESEFTPATDIGWRLSKSAWGKGFATEGAKRILEFAFEDLGIESLISTCTRNNSKSEHVMKKIGMTKKAEFKHPRLSNYPHLEDCLIYEINLTNKN